MKGRCCLLLVLALSWLVPFFLAGALQRLPAGLYSRLAFQYKLAGLFTRRNASWSQMLIQVRTTQTPDWVIIETAELSPMGALGYRQRLDRLLQLTNNKGQTGAKLKQRLAEWVAGAYSERHPEAGEVAALRIGQFVWPTNSPELTMPASRWVAVPASLPAGVAFRPVATYSLEAGKARAMVAAKPPARPAAPAAGPQTPSVFKRKGAEQSPVKRAP